LRCHNTFQGPSSKSLLSPDSAGIPPRAICSYQDHSAGGVAKRGWGRQVLTATARSESPCGSSARFSGGGTAWAGAPGMPVDLWFPEIFGGSSAEKILRRSRGSSASGPAVLYSFFEAVDRLHNLRRFLPAQTKGPPGIYARVPGQICAMCTGMFFIKRLQRQLLRGRVF
jgi:hypothetical protein